MGALLKVRGAVIFFWEKGLVSVGVFIVNSLNIFLKNKKKVVTK